MLTHHSQTQTAEEASREVELFSESEELLIGDERQSDKLMSVNRLLVREGFAEQTFPLTPASSCAQTTRCDDFSSVSILKAHLMTKCTDHASSQLLEALFDTNAENDKSSRPKGAECKASELTQKAGSISDQRNILVEGVKVSVKIK